MSGEGHVLVGPDGVLVEVTLKDVQVLAEISNLRPVALNVVQVAREVW